MDTIFLPNSSGIHEETEIPKHIIKLLKNVKNQYDYTFKFVATDNARHDYGMYEDIDILGKWVKKYFTSFEILKFNVEANNYYVLFKMSDPVCLRLEEAGYIK